MNDYIISSVCSTLLLYGGFSIAVKKKGGEEREKKYKGSHLVPGLCSLAVGNERSPPLPSWGARAADPPTAGSGIRGNECPLCWFISSLSPPHPLATGQCAVPGAGTGDQTSRGPGGPKNGCGCHVAPSWPPLPGLWAGWVSAGTRDTAGRPLQVVRRRLI